MSLLPKHLVFGSLLLSFLPNVFASHFFTEIYQQEESWRVDQFEVPENKLQERISTRSFQYRFEALAWARKIAKASPKSAVKLVPTEVQSAHLWKVTQSWNQEWEEKYAKWVEENLDVDFFVRHNFETDCADVAYTLRWIFARNNGLPASATLAATQATVTHEVMKSEWVNLPTHAEWSKDRRFTTAMRWLLNNVYTKTLYLDAYPIELRKETIQPGLVHLTGGGGHTEVFNKVSYVEGDTPMEVMSSTLPVAVRTLSRRIFMEEGAEEPELGGLIRFRWPVLQGGKWVVIPKERMPFYSLEQYQENLCGEGVGLAKCIMQKLGIKFDPLLVSQKLLAGHEGIIKDRLTWVQDGHTYCLSHDCAPGSQGYEDYGTPSRDKRILKNFEVFQELISSLGEGQLYATWEVETRIPGLTPPMTMQELKHRMAAGFVSYDPRDSIGARWALTTNDIRETVNKKYQTAQGLRSELIQKSAGCRANPVQCQRSKNQFNELTTIEIDIEIRKLLGSWMEHCKRNVCESNHKYLADYQKIWRMSPAPWDSLEERLGEQPLTKRGHVLLATSVMDGGEDFLILSSKELYQISARKIVKFSKDLLKVFFEKSLNRYLLVYEDSLSVLDSTLAVVKEIPLPASAPDRNVHLFQNGKAIVTDCSLRWLFCPSSQSVAVIVDLNRGVIDETLSVSSVLVEKFKQDPAVIIAVDTKKFLLEVKGATLSKTELPSISRQLNMFHRFPDGALFAISTLGEEYEAGFYTTSGWESVIGSKYMSLESMNSHFVMVMGFDPSVGSMQEWIVGADRKLWPGSGALTRGYSPAPEQRFFYTRENGEYSATYFMDGDTIVSSTVSPKLQMRSAWDDAISAVDRSNQAGIFDLNGKKLEDTGVFVKANCSETYFSEACFDTRAELLLEYYKVPEESGNSVYLTYYKFGENVHRSMGETYAYRLEKNSEDEMRVIWGEGQVGDRGMYVILDEKNIMWFPSADDSRE